MFVILNEVKNLIISTESIREILRLSPQNDITTQSLGGEGQGEGGLSPPLISVYQKLISIIPLTRYLPSEPETTRGRAHSF